MIYKDNTDFYISDEIFLAINYSLGRKVKTG